MLYSRGRRGRQKVGNPVREGKELWGNVKSRVVCLSRVCARVCGIRAGYLTFFVLSVVLQSSSA